MLEKTDEIDAMLSKFIESLDIFLEAYRGNVGKYPYGLLLGPREYTLLCMHTQRNGGVSEEVTKMVELVSDYKGISIRVKFTEGCEPELDPKKAAMIMHERSKKYEGYTDAAEQLRIEGI